MPIAEKRILLVNTGRSVPKSVMVKSMPRKLILGSKGFLGSTLVAKLQSAVGMDRSSIDLSKPLSRSATDAIRASNASFIVICAAITDVEKCFKDPALSEQVNVTGMKELLNFIHQSGAVPVFFSSDYVFAHTSGPHREDDLRAPETLYGRQKLAIENYLEENFDRYLIFRTSKLMSKTEHPRNILFQVLQDLRASKSIRAFEDQWLNPVFIEDIASVVEAACTQGLNGTYHLGSRRIFARDELAKFIATASGYNPALVQSIKLAELKFSEHRPNHNTLDCSKIENTLGFRFTEVADGIQEMLSL